MTKDEMLAVSHIVVNDYECGERANAAYNEVLNFGLENLPDEED